MVEYSVQHYADAALMRLLYQLFQIGVCSEPLIHDMIIINIIFMVGIRLENRRQIEGIHAELLYVVQILCDSRNVSSRKALRGRLFSPLQIDVSVVLLLQPAAEAFHKDLVENRSPHPLDLPVDVSRINVGKLEKVEIRK